MLVMISGSARFRATLIFTFGPLRHEYPSTSPSVSYLTQEEEMSRSEIISEVFTRYLPPPSRRSACDSVHPIACHLEGMHAACRRSTFFGILK